MTIPELQPIGGWTSPQRIRLAPPEPAQRSLLFKSLSRASALFGRADVPDVLTVLHVNPRLFWAWLLFASRLMPFGKLPATTREKLILRTAWNCRSRYEWGQHVEIALSVGVGDKEIVAVTHAPTLISDPVEQALMQACDDLHQHSCISEPVWQVLSAAYSEKLLIEIVMLVGHYVMIAGFLNSAGIVLEPPIEACLQAFNERVRA